MQKVNKIVLILIAAIVLGGVGYFVFPLGYLFYSIHSQMKAGQRYMDSISEEDIPIWIERTKKYLNEYNQNSHSIGVYGIGDKPVPAELRELGILRIDIFGDSVCYVWVGGLDHTYLQVQKTEHGDFKFIGNYNDYCSKVIWPKQETDSQPNDTPQ